MPRDDIDGQPFPSKAHERGYKPGDSAEWITVPKTIGEGLDELVTGGNIALGDLKDVNISSPLYYQPLIYDWFNEQWINFETIRLDTILDGTSGDEVLRFASGGASAVNEITITNAETGNDPSIAGTGTDTNVTLAITGKGTGHVKLGAAGDIVIGSVGMSALDIYPGDDGDVDLGTSSKRFGEGRFSKGIWTICSDYNGSAAPTDADLDAAFGQPGTVGDGFVGFYDDNGAGTSIYLCVAKRSKWWTVALAEAV